MESSLARTGLGPLQEAVLRAFFERERGFFLTGGAALVGFHLQHRVTSDIDLFTTDDDAHERSRHVVADLAAALDLALEVVQDAPGFRRYTLSSGDDAVVLDLVRERVAQWDVHKQDRGGIVVDTPREILANKLNTIVSRAEERDLIDVMFLERTGLRVEDALDAALAKDGGCTPATLAWLLSKIEIADEAVLPAGVSPSELREYVGDVVKRLRRAAAPCGPRD